MKRRPTGGTNSPTILDPARTLRADSIVDVGFGGEIELMLGVGTAAVTLKPKLFDWPPSGLLTLIV